MTWAIPSGDTYFANILKATPEGFEIGHLREALKHCAKFRTAVDGGAHIGTWTRHLSSLFDHVTAFEPAPDTFECLKRNTAGCKNVFHRRQALGAQHEVGAVVDDPKRLGNTGARVIELFGSAVDARIGPPWAIPVPIKPMVEVIPLDAFQIANLDFLKLDVEGHEYPALMGARETITRCRPTIVVECKAFTPPRNGGPERVVELLTAWGYRMVGGIRNDKVFIHP